MPGSIGTQTYKLNSGATTRPVDKVLGERVSVLDYGAKGDGITDDTASFARAIAASSVAGFAVFVPAGVYRLNNLEVTIGVRMYGDGRNKTILKSCGAGPVLWFSDGVQVLERMTIDGDNTAPWGIWLDRYGGYQAKLRDIEVVNCDQGISSKRKTADGILSNCYAMEWWGVRITDCRVGACLVGMAQAFAAHFCKIYGNSEINVDIGDGSYYIGQMGFYCCDVESAHAPATAPIINYRVNGVQPLLISGGYMEAANHADSRDVVIVGGAYTPVVKLVGVYVNDGVVGQHSISVNGNVFMAVDSCQFYNSTQDTFYPANLLSDDVSGKQVRVINTAYTVYAGGVASPVWSPEIVPGGARFNKSILTRLLSTAAASDHKAQIIMSPGGSQSGQARVSGNYGKIQPGPVANTFALAHGDGSDALGIDDVIWTQDGRAGFGIPPDADTQITTQAKTDARDAIHSYSASGNLQYLVKLLDTLGAVRIGVWDLVAGGFAKVQLAGKVYLSDNGVPGDESAAVLTTDAVQTVTNKIVGAVGSTVPGAVVGNNTAQTLTNKTIAFADNTLTGVQPALTQESHVSAPSGGSVVDTEARSALVAILSRLENLGLFASS